MKLRIERLATRFLLASCLLVATTVICGVWSALAFGRLADSVDATLRTSQKSIEIASSLGSILEREDDALLLGLTSDPAHAPTDLELQRRMFDERLAAFVPSPEQREAFALVRARRDDYRSLGDELLAHRAEPQAREFYHGRVNPALRRAVSACGALRELNFREMEAAARFARDEADRARGVVTLISFAALAASTLASLYLARAVVGPVRALTESVEAVGRGEFDRRLAVASADELGQLAHGFNRMAERLAEFRRLDVEAVVRAKETLEATLAALPDAVFVVDPDRRVVASNQAATRLARAQGLERLSKTDDLPLPGTAREGLEAALRGERREEGRADLGRALAVTLQGKARQLQPLAIPIPQFSSGRTGAALVLYDVTDFARLDELRSELVAVASHELKTPLTTLRMTLMMLGEKQEGWPARDRELLREALNGCEELARSIEEMLDLARIEAGQLRLGLERLDARLLVEQATRAFRPRFDDARVGLDVNVSDAAFLNGDSPRLASVLSNVLSNALKYSPPGGRVSVSARRDGAQVKITVSDQGPGVPEAYRERIFEKFFRVEHHLDDAQKRPPGAGFGLYLCRQIVEGHGGTIRCLPGENGVGATISIALPVRAE
ncbi:MAG TPA: ATP-binding protein [Planctomycetota bacterium]|nr:ATP-binding protein [Planctomycetota bacterium]